MLAREGKLEGQQYIREVCKDFRGYAPRKYPEFFRQQLDLVPRAEDMPRCKDCNRCFYDVRLTSAGSCQWCEGERSHKRLVYKWTRENHLHPLAVPNITKIASWGETLNYKPFPVTDFAVSHR